MKAGPQIETWQRRSTAGLHASRGSLYRTVRSGRQDRSGVTTFPLKLLPRQCPLCGNRTIIGHGQRRKQAHDEVHDVIRIRRGRCPPCHKTSPSCPSGRRPTATTADLWAPLDPGMSVGRMPNNGLWKRLSVHQEARGQAPRRRPRRSRPRAESATLEGPPGACYSRSIDRSSAADPRGNRRRGHPAH